MIIKAKHKNLTVLHATPICQPIKPNLSYGPIETIIHNIDKGVHSLGLRSIVACSGDSKVAGEHYVTIDQSSIGDYLSEHTPEWRKTRNLHLLRTLERAKMGDIDIIHVHDAKMAEYIYDRVLNMSMPIVMTLHVQARESGMEGKYYRWCNPRAKPGVYFIPISEYQKQQYNGLVNTENVVYHGIEVEDYPFKEKPDEESYLFNIGRITRDKGQDKAIELAKKTGSKLIIAGCVQNKPLDKEFFKGLKNSLDLLIDTSKYPVDKDYYDKVIKPLLDCDKQIIYIGEINREQKKLWYRHARATLFPIQWEEPFGLVLIESMACGTPIIAFKKGSVPEIVVDGKTGFVVDSLSAMIQELDHINSINPNECRRHVQSHFSIKNMACKYSDLYQQIIDKHKVLL
ncbi:D-inositol 3-phosphate glycosyltransferase [archaeon BMS3Abin17]|nr:D-inositol 3-phosphate glycosyltransferase [archaeon BMS3Abin17]HDZ60976.1 glycosyltransferase family 4 protein [Candidatus Pacearchaeota archaeon]